MEKEKINSYKDLIVWQKSMLLVEKIYKLTEDFPKKEIFGITSQIRRATVSIPSNIVEGSGRGSRKDYRQFLLIALGSSKELETQLEISSRLGFVKNIDETINLLTEIQKMLSSIVEKLK